MKTQLLFFLGFANVFERFMNDFAKSARPLPQLLRKRTPDALLVFNSGQPEFFEALKNSLVSAFVLKLSQFWLSCTLDANSSDTQVSCAILETYEGHFRYPIKHWSGTLNDADENYSTTE